MRTPRKEATGKQPVRTKPPEESPRTSQSKKAPENQTSKSQPSGAEATKHDEKERESTPTIKRRPLPKATVEEVEDSEDEGPPRPIRPREELPFRNVPPIAQVPLTEVLPPKPQTKPRDPNKPPPRQKAYVLRNNMDTEKAHQNVMNTIRNTIVPIPFGALVAGNPKIQKELAKDIAKTRRPNSKENLGGGVLANTVQNFTAEVVYGGAPSQESATAPVEGYPSEETDLVTLDENGTPFETLLFDTFAHIVTETNGELPEGSVIMGDPVLQYLDTLGPDEKAKPILVKSSEISAALRCVFPKINGEMKIEAITDSGSQIVSMLESVAIELSIQWKTDVQIFMQSANGGVEKTCGLARNVPFIFGDVVVYLQVHILKRAPYKCLLGRPFEILTESVFASKRDGEVSLTLTDPFTGARCTIPTYARGSIQGKMAEKEAQGPSSKPQDF